MEFLDLRELPKRSAYENTYSEYMAIFKKVAETAEITVMDPPGAWIPLLYYLGAEIKLHGDTYYAPEVEAAPYHYTPSKSAILALCEDCENAGRLREYVEHFESLRPELVDALYKSDMEWRTRGRRHQWQQEFVVASNGSFHRPEVLHWLKLIEHYRSSNKLAVMVPCAADKPYPSPLHATVAASLLRHTTFPWEMVIFAGTLGFCPQSLWPQMPHYDSGMPDQWRLQEIARSFIPRQAWDILLVYGDFYNTAIENALRLSGYMASYGPLVAGSGPLYRHPSGKIVGFVNPCVHYTEYLNLLDAEPLGRLAESAQKALRVHHAKESR